MMRRQIIRLCPLLAGMDAILGVLLLSLLGGFENGLAWIGRHDLVTKQQQQLFLGPMARVFTTLFS